MSYTLILCVIAFIAGIYQIFLFMKAKSSGAPIKGKVIGYEEGHDNRNRTTYNPIVRFQHNGETFEMPTELYDSTKKFELESEIEVYFLEGKDHVVRANGNSAFTNGIICLACGIGLLLIHIFLKH